MPDLNLYKGREQTYVKHFILEEYLERFARIIGWYWHTITYVDCFSGPWENQDPGYSDTSFGVALKAFRAARDTLSQSGRQVKFRCLFLEKDRSSFKKLARFSAAIDDIEISPRNNELADAVPDIVDFVQRGGSSNFTFTFFDPTGWTGFPLQLITPLLRVRPGEVLINFMTEHIRRFVSASDEELRSGFRELFDEDVRESLAGLRPQEREERLLGNYLRVVKRAGKFDYVGSAIVFKAEAEKTHFHLIYGTRNDKGIAVFKEVEKRAMKETETARATAKERKNTTGQSSFLPPTVMYPSARMHELHLRYTNMARDRVRSRLQKRREVKYADMWRLAVAFPLVWESDLRDWLAEWRAQGLVDIRGLKGRQQPRWDRDIDLIWLRNGA